MYSNIIFELTNNIKKLHALEESIIYSDKADSIDLRSKQALLISEVIQSLQQLEHTLKRETYFTITKQQESLVVPN